MCQRVLSSDDPEPAVDSVVLDGNGDAWQRVKSGRLSWRRIGYAELMGWSEIDAPLLLLWDGGDK